MYVCVCASCCRSGSDDQYTEKRRLLSDIADMKRDAEERQKILKAAAKAERDANKKKLDLCLSAMRQSRAGLQGQKEFRREDPTSKTKLQEMCDYLYVFLLLVTPRMERDVLLGEDDDDSGALDATDEARQKETSDKDRDRERAEPPRKRKNAKQVLKLS